MHCCGESKYCEVIISCPPRSLQGTKLAARVDPVRPSIFSNKSDERVLHRDGGLQGEVVDQKYKRPDLVVGLSLTASFVPHIGQLPPEKYSPFKNGYTCFPFLVVEAKSEKAGPGFEAIQRQSALAIRSCLKLQVDLETESGNELLHPLVWFIGYQGDEWRLYCAIPNGDETVSCGRPVRCGTDRYRMSLTAGTAIWPMKTKHYNCC